MVMELFPTINPIKKDLIKISIEKDFRRPKEVFNYIKQLENEEEKEFAWFYVRLLLEGEKREEDNLN